MTLTLNFQGQISNWLYLSQKWSDCHETKSKHIDWTLGFKCDQRVWPWPWPWPWIFKVKYRIGYISAQNGAMATKRKANISIDLKTSNVTIGFDLGHDLRNWLYLCQKWSDCHETKSKHISWTLGLKCDHQIWPWPWPWIFEVKYEICYISTKSGLIATKQKANISIWTLGLKCDNGFDLGHDIDIWIFKVICDLDHLVTKVRCKDLPDSDRGDFRCRRAVDSSSLCMADASLGAQQHIKILSLICFNLFFNCDQAALSLSVRLSVRPSVCPSFTPFSPCCCHRIITKFSGVIAIDKSDVHAKGQGQRSKVKVTEVIHQISRSHG